MKNIQKLRLAILAILAASVSEVFITSACQPTNEDTSATTTSNAATDAHTMDAYADHDMTGDAMPVMNKEYNDSMTVMYDEMMSSIEYSDPDVAFAQGMLNHHIGAVNRAKIQLKYGTDAEMRQLAQEIIHTQQSKIDQMQNWLVKHEE